MPLDTGHINAVCAEVCAGNVQGHGPCDDYSRSVTLPRFVASPSDIAKEAKLLLKMLAIPPQELRGVGLAVSFTLYSCHSGQGCTIESKADGSVQPDRS